MHLERFAYNHQAVLAEPTLPPDPKAYVVALIPAHNEEESIKATIGSLLVQTRVPNKIVVIANNCDLDDRTHEYASSFPEVTAIEVSFPERTHCKSRALNLAWSKNASDADIVVCIDADTELPSNAIEDWMGEFYADPRLGGSSSKFTMLGNKLIVQVQRAEFAKWTDTSLRRGWTSVLAGTGCAIRGDTLRLAAASSNNTDGPWCYTSLVEDFELTYRIRNAGYLCHVSPTVRAYTDAMDTATALWSQRMKWQVGTVSDLTAIGFNRMTALDWGQQALGLFQAFIRFGLVLFTLSAIAMQVFVWNWYWLLFPVFFALAELPFAWRIPHKTWRDITTAAWLMPQELFAYMRASWFVAAWIETIQSRRSNTKKDWWAIQSISEAKGVLK